MSQPPPSSAPPRRLPIGAEVLPAGGVHFRTWAPAAREVSLVLGTSHDLSDPHVIPLESEGEGYWSVAVAEAEPGQLYRFRLERGDFPDPASRFQPEGPHGPSQIVDPARFGWTDGQWKGVSRRGQVLYELHIGTFTPEGTWKAALAQLPHLADLGVTVLEVMPVADFPGNFGWGYDGVNLFAPTRLYGQPDDFRRFVDGAHRLGLGVILDVVYNHLGPDGNYLREFSPRYFSQRRSDWGDCLNFDDEASGPVREFFFSNAAYWIDEFHCDGLRLDAVQQIHDSSTTHILAEVGVKARAAGRGREVYLVAEDETQNCTLVRSPETRGYGLDAVWNDDFHHSAMVAATGRNEAYYVDYKGTPQEFISAAKWGFLFQGQHYKWHGHVRGTPTLDLTPCCYVNFLQNHDQIANSLAGLRLDRLTSPARLRALTALLLLGPNTPLLFQGQEFAASAPFLYFADHAGDLAEAVGKGRRKFLSLFPSIAAGNTSELVPAPESRRTFQRCKLDLTERERHAEALLLHRDLLHLRRSRPNITRAGRGGFDGAVLGPHAFLLRYFAHGDDVLLVVNLGRQLHLDPAPEPLLAPPLGRQWKLEWSSEDTRYGGSGTPALEELHAWNLPAECAVLLRAEEG